MEWASKSVKLRIGGGEATPVDFKYAEKPGLRWLDGGLTVVWLHGLPDALEPLSDVWKSHFVGLQRICAFAPDFSCLQSEELASLDGVCDALLCFLDTLKITTLALFAHSAGTVVARHFARKYPQRVRALVLVGAAARNSAYAPVAAAASGASDEEFASFVKDNFCATSAPLDAAALQRPGAFSRKLLQAVAAAPDEAAATPVPTFCVYGGQDTVLGVDNGAKAQLTAAQLGHGSKVSTIKSAPHCVHLDAAANKQTLKNVLAFASEAGAATTPWKQPGGGTLGNRHTAAAQAASEQ